MTQNQPENTIDFDEYSEQSVHFFSRQVPELLAKGLERLGPETTLVDVGCGDGHIVWALSEKGHIPADCHVIGVDIHPIRLQRFNALTGFEGLMADGHHIPSLATGTVDLAMSTMVIEHVPDDLGHVRELARITRHGGLLYLSTVIRKRGAWYFRKAPDGRRVLDPTHMREYPSVAAVMQLIESGGFVIKELRLSRLVFPIAHPLVRWWHARRPIPGVQRLFLKRSMAWLEALALPIPRYRSIEILAEHTSEPAFRILVVIPTLGERLVTLPRTLASIRNQARALIDLVIVTNNLTPELSALAELYHARVIVHPGHISAAVNAGFAQASKHHKYAGWLGDDDMLRPDALDTASALLERHPAAVVSYGACDYVDINGELLFNRRPPFNAPTLLQLIPGLIKQEACLFRLSALRKVGGLDEQLKYTMDLDLLLKLHRLGPFVRANHVHAAFCWHPDSLTVANRRASLDEAQQVQGMHVRGLARLLKPLWQHPIRRLILAMSSRINQGLHQPTTPAFRSHDNSQFVKYVLVGLVNTAFSYGVYAALIYIGQAYWIANLWALILGIAFSFTTHGTLVFRNATRATFVRFLAAWTLIYMFNTAVIAALMRASMNAYLAGAIATIPGTLASYFILKLVVFAWKKPAQSV